MADNCKVSVIVAAYNAAATIAACLDSIIGQTLGEWEAIVVDDCSTDKTVAVTRGYAERDTRIRLLEMPRNGGPSAARNSGIEAARGTWFAILDADDRFVPERLERMVQHAEQAGSDIVSDNPLIVTAEDPQGSPMFEGALMQTAHRVSLEEFILGNIGTREKPRVAYGFMKPLVNTAFFREKRMKYDERMRFSEDFVLYIHCMQQSARWDFMPDTMYLYTVQEASLSGGPAMREPTDLRPLYEFSRDLTTSATVRANPAIKRAAMLYYQKTRRWYSYRTIVEAVKKRQWGDAASVLYRAPDAIGGVVAEALVQAPALVRKVARKVPGLSPGA